MARPTQFNLAEALESFNKIFNPHPGQLEVSRLAMSGRYTIVYTSCGRKWGKSEDGVAVSWLKALIKPNSEVYYIAPELKQARELVWANRRMQTCCTSDKSFELQTEFTNGLGRYIDKINSTEMRIYLKNGSFIKVEGSDNYDQHRGWKPDFIVADEYRDFRREWWDAMAPNLNVKKATVLILTTPPEVWNHASDLLQYCKSNVDTQYCYIEQPSAKNNTIPDHEAAIEKWRRYYLARDEYDVFRREYLAEFVTGGKNAILPQITKQLCISDEEIIQEIQYDHSKLEWYAIFDPGNITCFAALFVAVNPYTTDVYFVDCIYETNTKQTSVGKIWPVVEQKTDYWYPNGDLKNDWYMLSDTNPATFRIEVEDQYNLCITPVNKRIVDKEEGISLLKDLVLGGRLKIAKSCLPFITECENYVRDPHGNPPKRGDHLIDCARYWITNSSYSCSPRTDGPQPTADEVYIQSLADPVQDRLSGDGDDMVPYEDEDFWEF